MLEKDWLFRTEEYICDLRVAGVLMREGKILVQRDVGGNEYALPGGHVRIGETTEAALIREYREEAGAAILVQHILWTEECFWKSSGIPVHNLCFYYLIALEEGSAIPDTGAFVPHRDNPRVEIGWMPVNELSGVIHYPEFLMEGIRNLDAPPHHYVTRA